MNSHCVEVSPRSRKKIRSTAQRFRELLRWQKPYFPVVDVLEFGLTRLSPRFDYEICSQEELGDNHGLTYPDQQLIKIRNDVYEGACGGNGFYRLTIAHEIGHLVLHTEVGFARSVAVSDIPAYRSSEWQANCFAGELLVSYQHVAKCASPEDVMQMFGVTRSAAETQWSAFEKDGIV